MGLKTKPALERLPVKAVYGLFLLVVLLYPQFANKYWVDVANFFFIYVILGLSLNIIVGYAGIFNLGHAAFYAVGAYSTAILATRYGIPTLTLMPVAALLAAGFAFLISKPILHLRGDYLCVVTIGFGEIVRIALYNDPFGLTGGPNGILGIPRPMLAGLVVRHPMHYFYLFLVFVCLTIFVMKRLEDSRLGRAWLFIREDELAAESMGIDTTNTKLLAMVLGAAGAGIAGNLYAGKMTVIAPESFVFWESVVMFCIVILGGLGSIPGIIVGAFGMSVLPEFFRGFIQWRMLVFGAAMVAMMLFRPQGLWPSYRWFKAGRLKRAEARQVAQGVP